MNAKPRSCQRLLESETSFILPRRRLFQDQRDARLKEPTPRQTVCGWLHLGISHARRLSFCKRLSKRSPCFTNSFQKATTADIAPSIEITGTTGAESVIQSVSVLRGAIDEGCASAINSINERAKKQSLLAAQRRLVFQRARRSV